MTFILLKQYTRLCMAAHRDALRERLALALQNDVLQWAAAKPTKENAMGIGMILLVILVLALLGVIPTWPHSREWGYGPSGGFGLILLIVLILLVLDKI